MERSPPQGAPVPNLAGYVPSLAVHVVWHPALGAQARRYGRALFNHLFEDPDDLSAHGLRIPVRHWRPADFEGFQLPLQASRIALVVVLVDDHFLAANGGRRFLLDTHAALVAPSRLLPVDLTSDGDRMPSGLTAKSVSIPPGSERMRIAGLLNAVTHTIYRCLGHDSDRARVFISHARRDGREIARRVHRFLNETTVGSFLDAHDILEGDDWKEALANEPQRHLLLVIRTDAYATREWCQFEVLKAKAAAMPVVVLDALKTREARSFPYLGNAPVVREAPRPNALGQHELLVVLLREGLRFRHFERRVADLCALNGLDPPDEVRAAPPELLTMVGVTPAHPGGTRVLVYPDPPLGTEELALITGLATGVQLKTPTMLLAG